MLFEKAPIALDIGSSSVKLIELEGRGQKLKLNNLGLAPLPRGAIVNGELQDLEVVYETIHKLLQGLNLNLKRRRILLSLSGASLLVRRITFEVQEGMDEAEHIFEEARQYYQMDMADMYFRYAEIKSSFIQGNEKAFVVAAGSIGVIEQYVELVHRLGMKVAVIDTDVFCLCNSMEINYPPIEDMVALVNIGAELTQVVLMHGGEYLFSRDFYIGGQQYTDQIATDHNLEFENAESLKIQGSSGDRAIADQIRNSVQVINEMLITEVEQSIGYFLEDESAANLTRPCHIFLSGGAAQTLDLATNLSTRLQAPVQMVNPFNAVDTAQSGVDVSYLLSNGAIFNVGTGLGLRKPNE